MSYKVNVYTDPQRQTGWYPWWNNFLNQKMEEGWDFDDKENLNLNNALKEYNAIDEAILSGDDDSPYIIFDTEEDYLLFLLKFS